MTASAIKETLIADAILSNDLGVEGRVFELQEIDERPSHDGIYVVLNWQESTLYTQTYTGMQNGIDKAPRVLQIWVHISWDISRDYDEINRVLNRIDSIFDEWEHVIGTDGQRITTVRKAGRSGNLKDEGFQTITRHAIYGVLYDESAA